MRFPLWLAAALLAASPALAQQATDQCATQPNPANGDSGIILRLRCTIQVLDAERMQDEDAITDANVRAAIADAKSARLSAQVGALEKANDALLKQGKANREKPTVLRPRER